MPGSTSTLPRLAGWAAKAKTDHMEPPETRYARSGDVSIAYQVVGEGPFDLVYVPGSISHIEMIWEDGAHADVFRSLAAFSRLILFDKRGTGLSDRVGDLPDLETRMDDVRAVMDAAGSRRAALMGASEGAPMTLLFAATYPERTAALVIWGGIVSGSWSPRTPWERTREETEAAIDRSHALWGTPELGKQMLERFAPSAAEDQELQRLLTRYLRSAASPGALAALMRMNLGIDVQDVLPSISVPTLIFHRTGDRAANVRNGRLMAEAIPHARYVELPGDDHLFTVDPEPMLSEVEVFLSELWRQGSWEEPEHDRVLATVLFTDIVGATARAVELGDRAWRELLEKHHQAIRTQLARFRGREVDTAGDGFFATFDGPARAIRCACAIQKRMGEIGLEVRVGVHTGECELMDTKVGGVAVHIGARVAAQARPGEVLVSRTVKDLVAGSGIEFDDRGDHALKGVPGEWRLFAVMLQDHPSIAVGAALTAEVSNGAPGSGQTRGG